MQLQASVKAASSWLEFVTAQRQTNSANMPKDAIQAIWANKGLSRTAQMSIETVLAQIDFLFFFLPRFDILVVRLPSLDMNIIRFIC